MADDITDIAAWVFSLVHPDERYRPVPLTSDLLNAHPDG